MPLRQTLIADFRLEIHVGILLRCWSANRCQQAILTFIGCVDGHWVISWFYDFCGLLFVAVNTVDKLLLFKLHVLSFAVFKVFLSHCGGWNMKHHNFGYFVCTTTACITEQVTTMYFLFMKSTLHWIHESHKRQGSFRRVIKLGLRGVSRSTSFSSTSLLLFILMLVRAWERHIIHCVSKKTKKTTLMLHFIFQLASTEFGIYTGMMLREHTITWLFLMPPLLI